MDVIFDFADVSKNPKYCEDLHFQSMFLYRDGPVDTRY